MKNIKKFEELDYLSSLRIDKKLRDEQFSSEKDEIAKKRVNTYLDDLKLDKEKRERESDIIEKRENTVHLLVQGLIYSDQNKEGFQNFKSDVEELLSRYPIENLPKMVNRHQKF